MAVAGGGLAAVAALSTGGVAQAAQIFTVTNLNDSGTGSLRAATAAVNADTTDTAAPGDSIVFASGLTGTIALTTAANSGDSLAIYRPVQIAGPGANQLTIRAAPSHRVIHVAVAKISGLTLTGGASSASGGGAIYSYKGPLELDQAVISGNSAELCGGIDSSGAMTLNGSTISGNTSTYRGGGACADHGAVTVNDSTINGNTADTGGGIFTDHPAPLAINDSTITGNAAKNGAGIASEYGMVQLTGSTVAGNTINPGGGGGQIAELSFGGYHVSLQDTIVSGSGSVPDVVLATGDTGSASFSLIRNAAAPSGDVPLTTDGTDITGTDPQLGALAFNGGPTETIVPLPTSPVLDQGKAFGLATDQRGLPRPFVLRTIKSVQAGGDHSDIGAVEVETPAIAAISPGSGTAGTHVGIVGTGFTGATQVLFGSIPASSVTVLNDGALTAVAPVNVQTQDVRVITPLGESPVVGADRFTFPTFTPTVAKHKPKLKGNKLNTGLTLTCPGGGLSCTGTFKATTFIKHHKTKLAGGSITLTAGQNKTITFKLSKKALKALKSAGKLKITIQFVIADGTEPPTTINETITLKHKHKKH